MTVERYMPYPIGEQPEGWPHTFVAESDYDALAARVGQLERQLDLIRAQVAFQIQYPATADSASLHKKGGACDHEWSGDADERICRKCERWEQIENGEWVYAHCMCLDCQQRRATVTAC